MAELNEREWQRLMACLDSIYEATGELVAIEKTAERLGLPWRKSI